MTARQHYSTLIDEIFGHGTTNFDKTKVSKNNVTGALQHPTEYSEFKSNFIARLHRLKAIYSTHPEYLKDIIVQINQIADNSNWEGAYAELACYDHFNQDILKQKNHIYKPIQPNVTLTDKISFAAECQKQETNLDGLIEDLSLYFDVKCLKDNVSEILEGIYDELKKHLGTNDIHITAEYSLDAFYEDYQIKRHRLLAELKAGITLARKETYINSTVIANLSFRVIWGSGLTITTSTYTPFSYAEKLHKTIFNYASKLIKNEPTLIILVVFPWYNQVVTDHSNFNSVFYRAMSRRVFCQYKFDQTLFNDINFRFTGDQTIYEVSNYISGIVFLEDKAILSVNPDSTNVESFIYLNPNAVNPITNSLCGDFLRSLNNSAFDDFKYDNY